jgi:hypothetical protein
MCCMQGGFQKHSDLTSKHSGGKFELAASVIFWGAVALLPTVSRIQCAVQLQLLGRTVRLANLTGLMFNRANVSLLLGMCVHPSKFNQKTSAP